MKKLISLGVSLPIAAASLLGVAGQAKAAVIGFTSDQFNFSTGFQTVGTLAGETVGVNDQTGVLGDTKGANNGNINVDLLWSPPTQGAGGVVTPANRIINQNNNNGGGYAYCLPVDANVLDAQVGECGRGRTNGDQAGAFEGILDNDVAMLRNIDRAFTTPTTSFDFDAPWLRLFTTAAADPTGVVRQFDFMLTSSSLTRQPSTIPAFLGNTDITAGPVDALLQGIGMIRQTDTTCSAADIAANVASCVTYGNFSFAQTTQGFRDDGLGGDAVRGDFITNVTSTSFSIVVAPKAPEPGAIMGLLAFVGLGSLVSRKNRSK